MGGKLKAPAPSPQETQLRQQGMDLLSGAIGELGDVGPMLRQRLGLDPGLEGAMSPEERLLSRFTGGLGEGLLSNLSGQADPVVQSELENQRRTLMNDIAQKGQQDSTIGAQRIAEFDRNATIAMQSTRTSDLLNRGGLFLQGTGLGSDIGQRAFGNLMTFPTRSLPLQESSLNLQQPFAMDRQMQFQANQQNAANRAALISSGLELAGTIGGAALLGPLGGGMGGMLGKMAGGAVTGTQSIAGAGLLPDLRGFGSQRTGGLRLM